MKLAATGARLTIPQSRIGRRPISVANFLKKDREGLLFKRAAVSPEFSKLEEFQRTLEPGDILLTRALKPTLLGRIVSAVQGSPYGHSALYAGEGKVIDTRTRRGVFETTLQEVHEDWGGGRDIRALRPRVSAEERTEAVARAREDLGKPYSLTAALRLALPPAPSKQEALPTKKDALICSQLVARAYPTLNIARTKARDHVMPVDFDKSSLTQRISSLVKRAEASPLEGSFLLAQPHATAKPARARTHHGDGPTRESSTAALPVSTSSGVSQATTVEGPGMLGMGRVKVGTMDYSKLASFFYSSFFHDLEQTPPKVAEMQVTPEEARESLKHLQELQRTRPSSDQLQRGATVGALVGPVAASMSKTIGGTWKPSAVGNLRELAASSASGAVFGGLMPAMRHKLEQSAETNKLEQFNAQAGVRRIKVPVVP